MNTTFWSLNAKARGKKANFKQKVNNLQFLWHMTYVCVCSTGLASFKWIKGLRLFNQSWTDLAWKWLTGPKSQPPSETSPTPPTDTHTQYCGDNWVWTREMEIISSSEVHNGEIVVCWVLIMARSDLAGMLVHSMFKLVSCGKTTSAWLGEFNLWPLICEVIRKRKIMSTVRNEYITGNLQLNNSNCVDGDLDYLSHTATKMLPGTVPAALERTFERLIQCLLGNRCSSPSWHCSTHWTTCCSLKTLRVHTRLELLWGEILSQDVLDCEKLVS